MILKIIGVCASRGYNHVCEGCGNEWMSWNEDESCPRCGSGDTQSYVIR